MVSGNSLCEGVVVPWMLMEYEMEHYVHPFTGRSVPGTCVGSNMYNHGKRGCCNCIGIKSHRQLQTAQRGKRRKRAGVA